MPFLFSLCGHGRPRGRALLGAALAVGFVANASAVSVSVTIENLTGEDGLFLTPVWLGFHDGSFDLYNQGDAASAGLERLAEDGATAPLSAEFAAAVTGGFDTTVIGPTGPPPVDPGESFSNVFDLDPNSQRFFSYASMVIPSNDAFIANGNPLESQLFDDGGNFLGPIEILVLGAEVLDAGTEVNTELDAAFLNQSGDNTGDTEGGTVQLHPGFIGSVGNPGTGGSIFGGTNAAGALITAAAADFTQDGFQLARITLNLVAAPAPAPVPEPAALSMLGLGLGLVALGRRRRQG